MDNFKTFGIFQADVVLRTMLLQAIRELRASPWLLNYAFAQLRHDSLTSNDYGEKEIEQAKKWFLSHEITVQFIDLIEQPTFPMITIQLSGGSETESTVGDVHYNPISEESAGMVGERDQIILGPFTPTYDPDTGIVTIPDTLSMREVFPDQILFSTRANKGFEILEVTGPSQFRIQSGVVADFTDAKILPSDQFYFVELESCAFKETYTIGCHVAGEQKHLLYLYSILVFILLRWKEDYLENRGFERSTVSYGPVGENPLFEGPERVISRTVQLNGTVRHYWPKRVTGKIVGVDGFDIAPGGSPGFIRIDTSEDGPSF